MMFHDRRRRLRLKRPKLRRPNMNQLIPNMLTVAALCAGLTAIRFATMERWDLAVIAVVIAGIFDGLDGRMARLLNGTSKFGAELDSLSDFISFGVAPAVMLYLWSLDQMAGTGWAVVLLYAVCCALRLARFNTAIGDPNPPPWSRHYFVGVPAPAGAGLAMLPIMLTFEIGPGVFDRPILISFWLAAVALLMVSRVPTFSIKQIRVPPDYMLPALLLVGLVVAALASEPWLTLIAVGLIYLISIPFAIAFQLRVKRMAAMTVDVAMPTPSLPPQAKVPEPPA
jgi:CDP-diacylglycerol--serine O-phosphatidyltransferase